MLRHPRNLADCRQQRLIARGTGSTADRRAQPVGEPGRALAAVRVRALGDGVADEFADDDGRTTTLYRPGAEPPIGTKGGVLLYKLVCIHKKNKPLLDHCNV